MKKKITMKAVLFSTLLAAVLLASCSNEIQESKVPSVVKNTLVTTFSYTGPVDWEKEQGNYEAEFREDTLGYKALISPQGVLLRYKEPIAPSDLPAPVQQVLQEQYRDHGVEDLEKLVMGEQAYYQLELEKGLKELQVVITADGMITNAVRYWD